MHTKGPWKVMDLGDGYRIVSGKKIIAGIYFRDDVTPHNARLIAAAPEMLDAMRRSFDIIGNIPEDLSSWNETNSAIQEAHDILEEAIRKAKRE